MAGRLLILLACLVAGGAIAAAGLLLHGHPGWALAIPAALVAGWWALADPTRCARPPRRRHAAAAPRCPH